MAAWPTLLLELSEQLSCPIWHAKKVSSLELASCCERALGRRTQHSQQAGSLLGEFCVAGLLPGTEILAALTCISNGAAAVRPEVWEVAQLFGWSIMRARQTYAATGECS